MSKDVNMIVTVNENGDFSLTGEFKGIELIIACAGLVKASAEKLGESEVEVLKNMLIVAEEESREKNER